MTNETRANRPAAPSQMIACAAVTLAVLFVAVAVVGTLAADDRPNGERLPQPVAQSSDSRDDVSATPPAHPTAGKRNGKLLPVCAYEVAAIIDGPGLSTAVTGLNEKGWVCGFWAGFETDRAFYWRPEFGQNVYTIPLPSGYIRSFANDISDTGLVVGSMDGPGHHPRGFVYDTNTEEMVTILDPVDPDGSSSSCWANAINNDGIVVGARSIGDTQQPYNAFIWTPGPPEESGVGTYEDLGVMKGPNSTATDLNEFGAVTGWTGPLSTTAEGFYWNDGKLIFLGPIEMGLSSFAYTINNEPNIAGSGHIDPEQWPGITASSAVWDTGQWSLLPMPNGCTASGVRDSNDSGTMAGRCTAQNLQIGVVWIDDSYLILNEAVNLEGNFNIRWARNVNNSGQVTAIGTFNGSNVGFLLKPIPRPLGDLTGDCEVGTDDLVVLLQEWGKRQSPADFNGDGLVDGADLGILLSNWTK